jgi:hypothetical protein
MTDPIVKYEYAMAYNFRPDELYGMGKESLRTSGQDKLSKVLERLQYNSSIKFKDATYQFYGLDECIETHEPWVPYIGQPMFFVYDIKITPVEE